MERNWAIFRPSVLSIVLCLHSLSRSLPPFSILFSIFILYLVLYLHSLSSSLPPFYIQFSTFILYIVTYLHSLSSSLTPISFLFSTFIGNSIASLLHTVHHCLRWCREAVNMECALVDSFRAFLTPYSRSLTPLVKSPITSLLCAVCPRFRWWWRENFGEQLSFSF